VDRFGAALNLVQEHRLAVVINALSGKASRKGAKLAARVVEAFAKRGATIEPMLVEGWEIAQTVAELKDADVVAVGGGDGTLGAAAEPIRLHGQTMAILPLGTLNHLSIDLGIPPGLEEAAGTAVHGTVRTIDLGQVADLLFVNNASVGLYTKLVRAREARQLPDWLATISAALTVLRGLKTRRLELEIAGARRFVETPLLFIGNNPYNIAGPRLGRREALDTGMLALYAVRHKTATALIGFALRALLGHANPARDFVDVIACTDFTLLGSGPIDVAHDGEVTRMELPLRFRSLPQALKAKVPGSRQAVPQSRLFAGVTGPNRPRL
jgi:diacylglycerol kinase family enzyme